MFQMKRLRESVIAKLTAWVLCIVSVMGSVVLGILVIIGVNEDLFYKTRDEMLKNVYESVNAQFALQAVKSIETVWNPKSSGIRDFSMVSSNRTASKE